MRRACLILTVAGLALASLSASCAQEPAAPSKAKDAGEIRAKGVVVDLKGNPVRGAQVFALIPLSYAGGEKPIIQNVPVDKNGRFVFEPKIESDIGYYHLTAAAKGYACGSTVFLAGQTGEIKITLRPAYTIKGRVVDERGKPVRGAKVEVGSCGAFTRRSDKSVQIPGNPAGLLEAVTGKDGRFAISHLPKPRDYEEFYLTLKVSKKGRATVQSQFMRDASTDMISGGITLKQPPECFVEGVLYLPGKTGPAPEGTRIAVLVPEQHDRAPRIVKTDKRGRFRVDALPPGRQTIALAPPGYGPGKDGKPVRESEPPFVLRATTKDLKPNETARLELVAEPGAIIKGKVAKKSGEGVADAQLVIRDTSQPKVPRGYGWRTAITDDKGEFTARVASGDVVIAVRRAAGKWFGLEEADTVELKVADGEEKTDVVVTLSEVQGPSFDYDKALKKIPEDFELRPGTYELAWDPEIDCAYAARSYSRMSSDEIKRNVKGNPELKSERAQYFACRFDGEGDDGCLLIVLDESKGKGKGWDTAYVDLNRNWDLSDEQPIRFGPLKRYRDLSTDEFSVPLRQRDSNGGGTERIVRARLMIYGDGDYVQASAVRKGAWKGLIDSNKGRIECVVLDDNCNGICGEPTLCTDGGEFESEGDRIYIDTNGAGSVIVHPWESSHCVNLYRVSKVGDNFYTISTTSLGDKVTIEPYTGEMGTLLVRPTDVQGRKAEVGAVSVVGGPGYYEIKSADKAVSLPVGKYRINTCSLAVKCAKSMPLDLECQLHSPVEIRPNEQTTVELGGRLSTAIDPDKKELVWRPGASTVLNWVIKLGDNATVTTLGGEERYSSSPKVKFFDRKGKHIRTVSAGYT